MERTFSIQYDEKNEPYIELETTRLFFDKSEPPEWALEKARNELRELPEIVGPAIQELRELIQNEENLEMQTDDEFMKLLLRPCKYYPESAFRRVKNYAQAKLKHPEILQDLVPSKLKTVFEEEIFTLIPNRDQDGRRIFISEAGKKWNPSRVPLNDLFRASILSTHAGLFEPITQICGAVTIYDMESLPLSHVWQFSPRICAMLLQYIQDCSFMRIKTVHVVNNPYIFNMLFALFKPFIREKLRKRIFIHGKNFEALHSHIDPVFLPPRYGGTFTDEMPPGNLIYQMFDHYNDEFENFNKNGYKEGYKMPK